jgi:putative PIG3 family NAD(P)H quinone oxidoreductase
MPKARAMRITGPGGPEVLKLSEIEVREPAPDEVLVQVHAAGVNRADILQRKGVYPAPPGTVPDVPGLEFAGVVERVGSQVRELRAGDKVMAITAGGAMATHIVAHERELVRVPQGMSLTDAAALPEVFMTAYDAMVTQGKLALGEIVLIHAVGSGVGTAALQLANALGATPIGTTRKADKLERAKTLGLAHGIVAADGAFADRVKDITGGTLAHVVLDTVGAKYLGENLRAVATGGTIVTIGLLGGVKGELALGLLVQKRAILRGSVIRARPLEEKIALARAFERAVVPLFVRGLLKPVVEDVLPMAELAKAHERLESDDTFGKLVMTWD